MGQLVTEMQYFLQIQKLFNFSYVYIGLDGYHIDFKSRLANSLSYTLSVYSLNIIRAITVC